MKSPHIIRSELFEVYEENLSRNEIKDDIEDVSLFGGRYTEPIVVCPVGEMFFYEYRLDVLLICGYFGHSG